ncbi:carbonic anhydrase 14-like isoform X7 [Pristis pectinata]|uniref:carbonic anhydrase 14-like isoform X7 n=1 Tax=Pristis pectinata TaxID=685728 RepID=UPI00223D0E15|nr:carbonic anhydrase 14-like isoform X7 [Pristis pectinata]
MTPPSALDKRYKTSHWEYDGPLGVKHWHEEFAHCGKEAQSPINIQTQYVHYDRSLKPVRLKGYSDPQCNTFHLSNNGHTVQMELPSTMVISSLPKRYRATQLHFHWGSLVWPSGSEHLIDGERAPAELHIVHYNTEKYRNMSEAMTKPDGLVVLGILLEVGNLKNPAYENILSHLESVTFAECPLDCIPSASAFVPFPVQDPEDWAVPYAPRHHAKTTAGQQLPRSSAPREPAGEGLFPRGLGR